MKRNNLKRVLCLALCFVLVMSLTGCKSSAVSNTEKLISDVGEVTADSQAAVEAAEEAFNALSDGDKGQVENAEDLAAAREALDSALRVKNVTDMIDSLGEITADSQAAIEAAQAALDQLPAAEKELVKNVPALEDAFVALKEARYQELLGKWILSVDATDEMCESFAGELDMEPDQLKDIVGKFSFESFLDLREDGTYELTADVDSIKKSLGDMFVNLRPLIKEMLMNLLKEDLLSMGLIEETSTPQEIEEALNSMLGALAGMSFDDLVDQAIAEGSATLDADSFGSSVQGKFSVDLDKNIIYFSEDADAEPDTEAGVSFSMEKGVLSFLEAIGEGFEFEGLEAKLPLTLTKTD